MFRLWDAREAEQWLGFVQMKAFPSEMTKEELARLEYELARKAGDKRFHSECQHERVSGGRCKDCWRKVVG